MPNSVPTTPKRNENCLAGYRCPKCYSCEPLWVLTTAFTKMYDDGTEHHVDVEYDNNSTARCDACEFTGKMWQFREELPAWVGLTDWTLLRKQKSKLSTTHDRLRSDEVECLKGIINLLDAVQDWAADEMKVPNVFEN